MQKRSSGEELPELRFYLIILCARSTSARTISARMDDRFTWTNGVYRVEGKTENGALQRMTVDRIRQILPET